MSALRRAARQKQAEQREFHSLSSGIFFKIKNRLYRSKSPYQKIDIIENEHFGKILLLDGLVQTTERDEFFYHEMLVHPAFVTHPNPETALIIGGGDGGALRETLRYPIKHACLVEIDRQVIDVCRKYFYWLSSVLQDQRVEIIVADGREFVLRTDRKFDIVFVDSSDPVGPSISLHEKDFYKKMKKCLNPEAVVIAQVSSPFYHPEFIRKKDDFLKKLFPIVCFFIVPAPAYPGGNWCFVFLSDKIHPSQIKRDPSPGLKYFNLDIHRASFAMPNYLKSPGIKI